MNPNTALTLVFLFLLNLSATTARRSPLQSKVAPPRLKHSKLGVSCVVQAFGTGLSGQGIVVRVDQDGLGCPGAAVSTEITSAAFSGGTTAQAYVNLEVNAAGVCMGHMEVFASLNSNCVAIARRVNSAVWGGGATGLGTCRALRQECQHCTSPIRPSTVITPDIDMWCLNPQTGLPEEMSMNWEFTSTLDQCWWSQGFEPCAVPYGEPCGLFWSTSHSGSLSCRLLLMPFIARVVKTEPMVPVVCQVERVMKPHQKTTINFLYVRQRQWIWDFINLLTLVLHTVLLFLSSFRYWKLSYRW